MSPKFEALLHSELARRVKFVIQHLIARGWNPVIPEIYGIYGTGYRSASDQLKLKAKHPGRTSENSVSIMLPMPKAIHKPWQ